MNITFVIPTLNRGGAERLLSVLSSELVKIGYEINIIVFYKSENEYKVSSKVNIVYDEEIRKKHNLLEKIKKVYRIRKLIKKWNSTFVLPFLTVPAIYTFLATRFCKTKMIYTVRNNPRIISKSKLTSMLIDYIAMRSIAIIAQTENEKSYYPSFVQDRTYVLKNPISEEFVLQNHIYKTKLKKIILIGRLVNQKNFNMMIEASRVLKERNMNFSVEIYGDGSSKDEINELINKYKLNNIIHLKGYSTSIAKELNDADIFVMTSNYEGMPNALIEAMSIGLPCISTNCQSGPPELIDDKVNGILIPVGDYCCLAEKIQFLINNPSYAEEIGLNASASIIKNHSSDIIARKFDEYIKEVYKLNN